MNTPRKNMITPLLAGESAVMFITEHRVPDENDFIHCATGPAVRFGTCHSPGDPSFFNIMSDPLPDSNTMKHRYKLFQVEVATQLPGAVQILPDSRTIGSMLHALIQDHGGAEAFGLECPTFAWFLADGYFHLLFHEIDAHFNIDIAMKQLSDLPGRPVINLFPGVLGRMTQRTGALTSHLRQQSMTAEAAGHGLPHSGMGGTLMRPNDTKKPAIFATPPLPNLVGGDPSSVEDLIDTWFRQIQSILRELKNRHGRIDVAFRSGGTIEIPAWFTQWCQDEGIEIFYYDCP